MKLRTRSLLEYFFVLVVVVAVIIAAVYVLDLKTEAPVYHYGEMACPTGSYLYRVPMCGPLQCGYDQILLDDVWQDVRNIPEYCLTYLRPVDNED
jgi:hypothetical protein